MPSCGIHRSRLGRSSAAYVKMLNGLIATQYDQDRPACSGLGRRQEHGEENDDDDDVYESRQKRTSGGLGSIDKGAIGQSSAYDSHEDAMAATKCVFVHVSRSKHAYHAV